jgi:hypothetical protein
VDITGVCNYTAQRLWDLRASSPSDDVNVFSGKLQIAVEPRLPDDQQWFLFAASGTYRVLR